MKFCNLKGTDILSNIFLKYDGISVLPLPYSISAAQWLEDLQIGDTDSCVNISNKICRMYLCINGGCFVAGLLTLM